VLSGATVTLFTYSQWGDRGQTEKVILLQLW